MSSNGFCSGAIAALCWVGASALGCTRPKADEDPAPPMPELPAQGPSCESGPTCGPESGSCCETLWVPGATFEMGFSSHEVPYPDQLREEDREHPVTVSGYFLDRYEITWSRLEAFAREYSGPPLAGSGAHPGLPATGWASAWDAELPATGQQLLARARAAGGNFSASAPADAGSVASSAAGDGDFAADRLSWFVAFAFCIWDGGRLPTEAEWENAAAGGARNEVYPWGSDPTLAEALQGMPAAPVGGHPELRGVFGQDDLAGGVLEWAFDWFSGRFYLQGGLGCVDCANTRTENARALRGAADSACCGAGLNTTYRAAARNGRAPGVAVSGVGARCARDGPRSDG